MHGGILGIATAILEHKLARLTVNEQGAGYAVLDGHHNWYHVIRFNKVYQKNWKLLH